MNKFMSTSGLLYISSAMRSQRVLAQSRQITFTSSKANPPRANDQKQKTGKPQNTTSPKRFNASQGNHQPSPASRKSIEDLMLEIESINKPLATSEFNRILKDLLLKLKDIKSPNLPLFQRLFSGLKSLSDFHGQYQHKRDQETKLNHHMLSTQEREELDQAYANLIALKSQLKKQTVQESSAIFENLEQLDAQLGRMTIIDFVQLLKHLSQIQNTLENETFNKIKTQTQIFLIYQDAKRRNQYLYVQLRPQHFDYFQEIFKMKNYQSLFYKVLFSAQKRPPHALEYVTSSLVFNLQFGRIFGLNIQLYSFIQFMARLIYRQRPLLLKNAKRALVARATNLHTVLPTSSS